MPRTKLWYHGTLRSRAWLARAHDMTPNCLYRRLAKGMPLAAALRRPARKQRRMVQAVAAYLARQEEEQP